MASRDHHGRSTPCTSCMDKIQKTEEKVKHKTRAGCHRERETRSHPDTRSSESPLRGTEAPKSGSRGLLRKGRVGQNDQCDAGRRTIQPGGHGRQGSELSEWGGGWPVTIHQAEAAVGCPPHPVHAPHVIIIKLTLAHGDRELGFPGRQGRYAGFSVVPVAQGVGCPGRGGHLEALLPPPCGTRGVSPVVTTGNVPILPKRAPEPTLPLGKHGAEAVNLSRREVFPTSLASVCTSQCERAPSFPARNGAAEQHRKTSANEKNPQQTKTEVAQTTFAYPDTMDFPSQRRVLGDKRNCRR